MALKPASTKASSSACDVFSSEVQPNTLPPNINGAILMPERPSSRNCMRSDRGAAAPILPQRRVDLVERGLTGAEVGLTERIERRTDRVQVTVQVVRVAIDIKEPGDDLPLGGVVLEKSQRRGPIMHVIVRRQLAQG